MFHLEWTPKNENRLLVIGTIIGAVLLTIFGFVVARYNAQHPAPTPSTASAQPS